MDKFLENYEVGDFSKVICLGNKPSVLLRDKDGRPWRVSFGGDRTIAPSSLIEKVKMFARKGLCFNFYVSKYRRVSEDLYAAISKGWISSELQKVGPLVQPPDADRFQDDPATLFTKETVFQMAYALKIASKHSLVIPNLESNISFYKLLSPLFYVKEVLESRVKCIEINKGCFVRINATKVYESEDAETKNFENLMNLFAFYKTTPTQTLPKSLSDFLDLPVTEAYYTDVMPCFEPIKAGDDLFFKFKRFCFFESDFETEEICNKWFKNYKKHFNDLISEVEKFLPNFFLNQPILVGEAKSEDQKFLENFVVLSNSTLKLEKMILNYYDLFRPDKILQKLIEFNVGMPIQNRCFTIDDFMDIRSKSHFNYQTFPDSKGENALIWERSSKVIDDVLESFEIGDNLTEHIYRIKNLRSTLKLWALHGPKILAAVQYASNFISGLSDTKNVLRFFLRLDWLEKVSGLLNENETEIKNDPLFVHTLHQVNGHLESCVSPRVIIPMKRSFKYALEVDQQEAYAVSYMVGVIIQKIEAYFRVSCRITGLNFPRMKHLYDMIDYFSKALKGVELTEQEVVSYILKYEKRLSEVELESESSIGSESETDSLPEEIDFEETPEPSYAKGLIAAGIAAGIAFVGWLGYSSGAGVQTPQVQTPQVQEVSGWGALSANFNQGMSAIPFNASLAEVTPATVREATTATARGATTATARGAVVAPVPAIKGTAVPLIAATPIVPMQAADLGITIDKEGSLRYALGTVKLSRLPLIIPQTFASSNTFVPSVITESSSFLDVCPYEISNGMVTSLVTVCTTSNLLEKAQIVFGNTSSITYNFTTDDPLKLTSETPVVVYSPAIPANLTNAVCVVPVKLAEAETEASVLASIAEAKVPVCVYNETTNLSELSVGINMLMNNQPLETENLIVTTSNFTFKSSNYIKEAINPYTFVGTLFSISCALASFKIALTNKLYPPVVEQEVPGEAPQPLQVPKQPPSKKTINQYIYLLSRWKDLKSDAIKYCTEAIKLYRNEILIECFKSPSCFQNQEVRNLLKSGTPYELNINIYRENFNRLKDPSTPREDLLRSADILANITDAELDILIKSQETGTKPKHKSKKKKVNLGFVPDVKTTLSRKEREKVEAIKRYRTIEEQKKKVEEELERLTQQDEERKKKEKEELKQTIEKKKSEKASKKELRRQEEELRTKREEKERLEKLEREFLRLKEEEEELKRLAEEAEKEKLRLKKEVIELELKAEREREEKEEREREELKLKTERKREKELKKLMNVFPRQPVYDVNQLYFSGPDISLKDKTVFILTEEHWDNVPNVPNNYLIILTKKLGSSELLGGNGIMIDIAGKSDSEVKTIIQNKLLELNIKETHTIRWILPLEYMYHWNQDEPPVSQVQLEELRLEESESEEFPRYVPPAEKKKSVKEKIVGLFKRKQ